jgi:outer membrane protein OmpA-like peptidoglycan-associated protein
MKSGDRCLEAGRAKAPLAAAFALALSGFAAAAAGAQGAPSPFVLVERSDFSRYLDGTYVGHAYREARGSLSPATAFSSASGASGPASGAASYAGEFLVLEETLRDMRGAARRVDRSSPARLSVQRGGALTLLADSGYPSLRGLPVLPDKEPAPGDSWVAPGTRALDFDDTGSFVLLPFLAEYRYAGTADYAGRKALRLTAKFATRWNPLGLPPSTSPAPSGAGNGASPRPVAEIIKNASGTHDLDIYIDAETLNTLFIRDRFDETFTFASGAAAGNGAAAGAKTERRSGFSLFFFQGTAAFDRAAAGQAIASAVAGAESAAGQAAGAATGAGGQVAGDGQGLGGGQGAGESAGAGPGALDAGEGPLLADNGAMGPGLPGGGGAALAAAGLELSSSPEGMVLRVKDLRFVADSDQILPSEKWRLDAIAAALKALPGKSFLVAGHSAAVGKASGELQLSIQRAKRVADELTARGIEPTRLLYRGFGSSVPLASNDTEEGRAKNRRVEITILD